MSFAFKVKFDLDSREAFMFFKILGVSAHDFLWAGRVGKEGPVSSPPGSP